MTTLDQWRTAAADVDPRTDLLIDGTWTEAASGRRFATVNPATGSPIADIAEADAADIDTAVASARAAADDGR